MFVRILPEYNVSVNRDAWTESLPAELNLSRVRAKTGSMSGVFNVSGYVETLDGHQLAFSLLTNGFIGSSQPVRDLRQEVWDALARYRAD